METELVHVIIEGTAPMLQNNVRSALAQLAARGRRKTQQEYTPEEDAARKLYRFSDPTIGGKKGSKALGHPLEAIDSALREAGREFKADKRRTYERIVKRAVFAVNGGSMLAELTDADGEPLEEWNAIHEATVVNPSTKGRMLCYRPMFAPGWRLRFDLNVVDVEAMPVSKVKELLDYAGRAVGIGDWRPRFGRFQVILFEK